MMNKAKPKELLAYEYFLSLGTSRTYKKVAAEFKVNERTIQRWAAKHKWTEKLEKHIITETKRARIEELTSSDKNDSTRQDTTSPTLKMEEDQAEEVVIKGRPTILSFELIKELYKVISAGVYTKQACNFLGISQRSYYSWMATAEKDEDQGRETIYTHFMHTMKKAQDIAEIYAINEIQKAAKHTWQAAAWYLERKAPDRWGRKDSIQYSGEIIDNSKMGKKIEDLLEDPDTIEKANEILSLLATHKDEEKK